MKIRLVKCRESRENWVRLGMLSIWAWGIIGAGGVAAELPREAVLPVALATQAAQAAMKQCTADGSI